MTVALLTHPITLAHDAGPGHPERPDRIDAVRTQLAGCGLQDRVVGEEPEPASADDVLRVHTADHIGRLEEADGAGGARLDPDTRMGPGSLEAALRGSGAVIRACGAVLDGEWDAAFSLMRPPGHHATADRAMGFCLVNHVAVAARWAVGTGRAPRVFVLDWDAHHGNGTQDIFYTDPDVLYASVHQYPWYPGTGDVTETGAGEGAGTTVNVPLPAGAGEDAYTQALDEVILPTARAFGPDLVLVSAGYDAHRSDPLCMMRLGAGAFFRFTKAIEGLGAGPVCVLEGGYDLEGLAWSVSATLSACLGDDVPVGVPEDEFKEHAGAPEAHRWVDRAAAVHATAGG